MNKGVVILEVLWGCVACEHKAGGGKGEASERHVRVSGRRKGQCKGPVCGNMVKDGQGGQ